MIRQSAKQHLCPPCLELAERTHTPHAVRNQAEAAYARSDLSENQRALMESWSDYLAA